MSNTPYLLALDQGTSSSRSIVFDATGRIVSMAQEEFAQHYPQPGWVEHDAHEIWDTQLRTARRALQGAGIGASQLASIGITNQRETTVVWDRRTGEPIYPAIVWQDRRTEPSCASLRQAGHSARFAQCTGLVLDPYFSGTKLAWILDHVSGARQRAQDGELAFGTIDSWLIWKLTGGALHATDISNASRTLMLNIHTGRWDDDLLSVLNIPASVLPQVLPSSADFGRTQSQWLGSAVPIGGVAGDQQSALFGQACFQAGLAKNTYGTGCFMLMHTGTTAQASRNGLVTTCAAQPGGPLTYALEGSVFIGGAVVQWLRDGLGLIRHSAEVEALAQSVPDSQGVVVVPAFTGLGAPHWDAQARGAILGLTRGTTGAHIARAALESIAFQSAELLLAMQKDVQQAGGAPVTQLRVDGGACVNDLLMQCQADLLGLPVVRPEVVETTALGAAYLAGLSSGVFTGLDELAAQWRIQRRFEPQISRDEAQARMAHWAHAVAQVRA